MKPAFFKRALPTLALAWSLSGCGLTALSAALVASSQSGGGGGNGTQTAPSLSAPQVPNTATGNLVVPFQVTDAENDPVNINVEIATNGGVFVPVPAGAIVSGSVQNLAGAPNGAPFSFTLDLTNPGLFPGQTVAAAQLRLTGTDLSGLVSDSVVSNQFSIANNAAPTVILQNNDTDQRQVAVVFNLNDAEAVVGNVVRGAVLSPSVSGPLALNTLSLTQNLPILPNTVLIRYDNGRVLRDDGAGNLIALNGPNPQGPASIDYQTGIISGPGTITLNSPAAVTADYNQSFLIVTSVAYDDLRDGLGVTFQPCAAFDPRLRVPFPAFVSPVGSTATFVWDAVADLDFGNSKFVSLRVTVSDGQSSASSSGNSFLINNGPFGESTRIPANGNTGQLEVADIDGDGFDDAYTVNSFNPVASLTVFYSNGQGDFLAPVLVTLPTPVDQNGVNLINSPPSGALPAGALDPLFGALADINQDGILDIAVGNQSVSPRIESPQFYNSIFVYFGTGNRNAPFDTQNVWGPLPTGGWGLARIRSGPLDDDNGDGIVDSNDTADLVMINRFSHDPTVTKTRASVFKVGALVGSAIRDSNPLSPFPNTNLAPAQILPPELLAAQVDGAPYNLNGVSLAATNPAPLQPGSLLLAFNGGANLAIDTPLPGGVLGLLIDISNPAAPTPFCYVFYPTGTFFGDPFDIPPAGLPRLAGLAFPGLTPFVNTGPPIANYIAAAPITPADSLNAGLFVQTPLSPGDTITIRGFGHKGLSVVTQDPQGNPLIGFDGQAPAALVTKFANLLPVNQSFSFGTQVTSFQDLLDQIQTLYQGQVINPAREQIVTAIDPLGRILVSLVKVNPGPDTNDNPAVRYLTTAEIQILDSQGNPWPLFEDPYGIQTAYHVIPKAISPIGGFFVPDISSDFTYAPPGSPLPPVQFFPPVFPPRAAISALLPQDVNLSTGLPGNPGPGNSALVQALVQNLGGAVPYPPAASVAGGNAPAVTNPLSPPAHLSIDPITGAQFTGGIVPRDIVIGDLFSVIPGVPKDFRADLVSVNGGDASYTAMVKVPKAALLAPNPATGLPDPALDLYFALFGYRDGLFANQQLDAAGFANTQIIRSGDPIAAGFLVQPNTSDLITALAGDVDKDGLLDLMADFGNFFLYARNLQANPPPPPALPFDVQIAVVGLQPGRPAFGDYNNDGLIDFNLPTGATKETVTLLQVPRGNQVLASAPSSGLTLTTQLTQLEVGRATIAPQTFRVDFVSNGVPQALFIGGPGQSPTSFSLVLVQNPDTNPVPVLPNAGSLDTALGTLSIAIPAGIPIDAGPQSQAVVANYDQLFQKDYFAPNAALLNYRAVRFPSGFIPFLSFTIDLDNNGLDDIVTLDGLTNNISYRLQQAQIGFDSFVNVSSGISPLRVVTGNVIQGNNATEVIVSNAGTNTVSVYVPDPVLGLRLVEEYSIFLPAGLPVPLLPFGVQVTNIDKDGGPDDMVIVCSAVGGAGAIPASAFGFPPSFDFNSGFIVVPGVSQAQVAAAQGQTPTGRIFQPITVGLGFGNSIEGSFADINGDGRTDIVIGNNGGNFNNGSVSFYPNRGPLFPGGPPNFANFTDPLSGTPLPIALPIEGTNFAPTRLYLTPVVFPTEVQTVDLNADGFPELLTGVGSPRNLGFASFSMMQGKDPSQDGQPFVLDPNPVVPGSPLVTYIDITQITTGSSVGVVPGDLNNDGKPDLVIDDLTTSASAGFAINQSDPGGPIDDSDFQIFSLPALGQPSGIDIADLNNDGANDVVITFQDSSVIAVYINNFDPLNPSRFDPSNPSNDLANLFAPPVFLQSGDGTVDTIILDANNDGKNDIVVLASGSNTVNVFFQR